MKFTLLGLHEEGVLQEALEGSLDVVNMLVEGF